MAGLGEKPELLGAACWKSRGLLAKVGRSGDLGERSVARVFGEGSADRRAANLFVFSKAALFWQLFLVGERSRFGSFGL